MGQDERFKFVDDLTVLEIVNLLTIGLCSYNIKNQVPNDLKAERLYIPPENLKSQSYLDNISAWTKDNKMKINSAKTKSMVFNFTNNYQFGTRLKIDNQIIKTISETKLLGTSDLKWTQNTSLHSIYKKSV